MSNRMNKEELLELLNSLKIDKEEFWILSTGALVLRGLFPDAGDLDIAVTNKGLAQLKMNYELQDKENEKDWYLVNEKVECVCDGEKEELSYQPELVDGYYLQNLDEYYEYLRTTMREKDREKIKIVERVINERNN